jgi:hypothetical protein
MHHPHGQQHHQLPQQQLPPHHMQHHHQQSQQHHQHPVQPPQQGLAYQNGEKNGDFAGVRGNRVYRYELYLSTRLQMANAPQVTSRTTTCPCPNVRVWRQGKTARCPSLWYSLEACDLTAYRIDGQLLHHLASAWSCATQRPDRKLTLSTSTAPFLYSWLISGTRIHHVPSTW